MAPVGLLMYAITPARSRLESCRFAPTLPSPCEPWHAEQICWNTFLPRSVDAAAPAADGVVSEPRALISGRATFCALPAGASRVITMSFGLPIAMGKEPLRDTFPEVAATYCLPPTM